MNLRKAALINASGKYSKILLSLIVNAILARLLSPSDYGVVAVVTVFSTFFSTFADMGLGAAIIQKKDLTSNDMDNLFSFSLYISFSLAIIFFFLAYPISKFYENRVYIPLVELLSISLFFDALNMVPNGILNREKKFGILAVRTFVVYLLASIVTVILALLGWRYYALAFQAVLSSVLTFLWNWANIKLHFHIRFNTRPIKKIFSYSSYQMGFNIINYFSRNLDNLLIGKFFGNAELGYYNKAYALMMYPVNNLSGVITPVLHPILSDYQDLREVMYKKYMKVFKLILWVGLYAAFICYLARYEIINIMYGPNWNETVSCFGILAISIIPQILNSSMGGVFLALGNSRLLFINGAMNTSMTVIAILWGIFGGRSILSVAIGVTLSYTLQFFTASYMLIAMAFRKSYFKFIISLWYELLMLTVLIIAILLYRVTIHPIILSAVVKVTYISLVVGTFYFMKKKFAL